MPSPGLIKRKRGAVWIAACGLSQELTGDVADIVHHAAYLATVQFRRDEVPDQVRQQLERLSFTVDQLFTYFREAVRTSQTFARMELAGQRQIEDLLLQVQ